ncbi:hypothetical protein DH2020_030662 [Rehmannia glutinosa]|uniref:TF-B3 domain-containing protein n=1 Tax=Rehmannia glutinosa TaxID=99300 RepID=A0ABR0VK85_REHGL
MYACAQEIPSAFTASIQTVQKTSVEEEEESSDDNYVSDSETDDEDSDEEIHANDSVRKKRKQACTREKPGRIRRVLSDIYGVEIFRSGLARQPENPYFVSKVNPKRKSEFLLTLFIVCHGKYIPKDLVIDHNLELPEEISFVDPNGRRWTSRRKIWKGGRTFYTKGWRKLCQCNFVKEDDICICEFIKIDQEHCVKVSFVRADRTRNDEHD